MSLILGYLLGRRRERPDVEWAQELDAHADELRGLVEALRKDIAVLERAVVASRQVVPLLQAQDESERMLVTEFLDALRAAEDELLADELTNPGEVVDHSPGVPAQESDGGSPFGGTVEWGPERE